MEIGWHKHEAIKFIYDAFQRYYPDRVGLILSLKYESMVASQRQYAKLIENPDIADILIGLDLVGNEDHFTPGFYEPLFRDWNKLGKMTRAHIGESGSYQNIIDGISRLHLTNIAHGVKILHAPADAIAFVLDRDVTFDLAITSNYLTGLYASTQVHPCKQMLEKGFKLTLSSDDPVQCSTNLKQEFVLARKHGLTMGDCEDLSQNAIKNTKQYMRRQYEIHQHS
jgi:adenosine deaminase